MVKKKRMTSKPSSKTTKLRLAKPEKMKRDVLDRITDPVAQVPRFMALIYAYGGVGKTTLLGTIPGRGLVIDIPQFEGGTSVLSDKAPRIKMVPVVDWDELNKLYQYLRKGEHPFDWVAIDTITGAQQLARQKVLKERDEIASSSHKLRIQDWGDMGQLMGQLFEKFRLLPIPVILLAQEKARKEDTDDDETITRIVPNVSPASLDALVPHPMLTGHLYLYETDEGKWVRQLRVGPHSRYITKARSLPDRPLPAVIRNPNLGNILAYMMGQDVPRPKEGKESTPDLIDLG